MDAVTGLLAGPRARNAFLLRCSMDPPWSVRIEDRAPLAVTALVKGEAWVVRDDGEAQRLGPGDVVIMRGPDPYLVADEPGRPAQVVIHPDQRCTGPDGGELGDLQTHGVRTWGNDPDGHTVMLVGTYRMDGEVSARLLRALPPMLYLGAAEWDTPLLELLHQEIVKDDPGQEAVLDRLLDLLVISVLRAWFARSDDRAPGWYRAYGDPIVGEVLRRVHADPAEAWTVETMAEAAGVSRATLARRFTDLVGAPPMTYLTEWRVTLAADLLREPDSTLGSVAHEVGYGSPFALSTAFKRVHGVSPREHLRSVEVPATRVA
jgi:AraC-like DNA-binding protein